GGGGRRSRGSAFRGSYKQIPPLRNRCAVASVGMTEGPGRVRRADSEKAPPLASRGRGDAYLRSPSNLPPPCSSVTLLAWPSLTVKISRSVGSNSAPKVSLP